MKKIAVFTCGEVSRKCPGTGCFRAFNTVSDSFERYCEEEIELTAYNVCPGCDNSPLENLEAKIPKLLKHGTDTVHISTCIRGRCPRYEKFAEMLSEHFDVVGYTHGSPGGKKNNTVNLRCRKQ